MCPGGGFLHQNVDHVLVAVLFRALGIVQHLHHHREALLIHRGFLFEIADQGAEQEPGRCLLRLGQSGKGFLPAGQKFVADKIVDLAAEQVADGVDGQRRFGGVCIVLHFVDFKFFFVCLFAHLGERRANDVAAKVDAEADQVEHNEKLDKIIHFAFLLSRSHAVSSLWQKPTQGWPGR